MNEFVKFKTLTDFTDHFRDESVCADYFKTTRFAGGEYCPHCKHREIYAYRDGKRYRCQSCKKDFTIRTGTLFGESKLPLRKWFMAIYLLSTSGKGFSSVQLAKHLGVTQKTAWFVAHRIRQAQQQDDEPLTGTAECDETWIGGKAKNMHAIRRRKVITGTGGTNKTPVFGIRARDGKLKAQVIPRVESVVVHPIIKKHLAKGSTLYTDEHRCYYNLQRDYRRGIVRHSVKEYVVGDCHTNGIESFWAVLKRGYHGVYHYMSIKHLQRYVNEFVFRFNVRPSCMVGIFNAVVQNIANTPRLPYKILVQSTV